MEATTQPQPDRVFTTRNLKIILWILLFLAATEFVMRGPVRFLREPTNWNDLSQNYTASKLWLNGQSPSDPRNFSVLWKREAGSRWTLRTYGLISPRRWVDWSYWRQLQPSRGRPRRFFGSWCC